MARDQADGDLQMPAEDSLEYKFMLQYVRKRRPADSRLVPKEDTSSSEPAEHGKPKKKSKKKRLLVLLKCVKPKTKNVPERTPAMVEPSDDVKVDNMEHLISELTQISDSVHFDPCFELETDNGTKNPPTEDEVVEKLVELLRAHGDELDEKIKANSVLTEKLKSLQYGFFSKVMSAFRDRVTDELPPPQQKDKVVVALICEATSKLSDTNFHPMNRVLGFGALFLQEKYSSWISRNMHVGNGEVVDKCDEEVQ